MFRKLGEDGWFDYLTQRREDVRCGGGMDDLIPVVLEQMMIFDKCEPSSDHG